MMKINYKPVTCLSFQIRNQPPRPIEREEGLAVAVKGAIVRTVEIATRDFVPVAGPLKIHWNNKFIGWFALQNFTQGLSGDRPTESASFIECEPGSAFGEIPQYKWRHDLKALAAGRDILDGASLEAGHQVDPIAPSWKRPIFR